MRRNIRVSIGFTLAMLVPGPAFSQSPTACPTEAVGILDRIAFLASGNDDQLEMLSCYGRGDEVIADFASARTAAFTIALHREHQVMAVHRDRQGLPFEASAPHLCLTLDADGVTESRETSSGTHTCTPETAKLHVEQATQETVLLSWQQWYFERSRLTRGTREYEHHLSLLSALPLHLDIFSPIAPMVSDSETHFQLDWTCVVKEQRELRYSAPLFSCFMPYTLRGDLGRDIELLLSRNWGGHETQYSSARFIELVFEVSDSTRMQPQQLYVNDVLNLSGHVGCRLKGDRLFSGVYCHMLADSVALIE